MSVYRVVLLKYYQKYYQTFCHVALYYPINQKTAHKKLIKVIKVLKKGGVGFWRGMIMITDSMGFFLHLP